MAVFVLCPAEPSPSPSPLSNRLAARISLDLPGVQLLHRLRGLHPADSAAPRRWSQLKKTGMSSNIPCHFLLSVRGGELGGFPGQGSVRI